jgi:hypothetical protein
MASPRHWNISTNSHATTRYDSKASSNGNTTVNVHSIELEWECDSQCALNRVGVLLKFTQRRRQPYNADIISNLTHRLGQNRTMNIKRTWVQAHQDEKKIPGQILSDAALRSIKVDSIAEDYLLDPRQPQTSDNARKWVRKPSAYAFKEPGSLAATRMLSVRVSMDLTSVNI